MHLSTCTYFCIFFHRIPHKWGFLLPCMVVEGLWMRPPHLFTSSRPWSRLVEVSWLRCFHIVCDVDENLNEFSLTFTFLLIFSLIYVAWLFCLLWPVYFWSSRCGHIFRRHIINSLLNQTLNEWMFSVTKSFVFHSFHHSNLRAVEIIWTEDCRDVHVVYEWIESFDHDCTWHYLVVNIFRS